MKLSKKLKWTLGLASMAALTAIPMSVALVGCSKENDKNPGDQNNTDDGNQNNTDDNVNQNPDNDSSNNNQLINDNFVTNVKNINIPIDDSTTQEQYNKIKLVAENWDSKDKSENLDAATAYDIANNWLNSATDEQIENMLLINFNRMSSIYSETSKYPENNSTTSTWIKNYISIKLTSYDAENHVVSFEAINMLAAYKYSDGYLNYISDAHSELKQAWKQVYKFDNIKLTASQTSKLPIITIDPNYPETQISCTFSDYQDTYYELFTLSLRMLDYAKDNKLSDDNGTLIDGEHYENLKKSIEQQREIYDNCYKDLKILPELDWSSISFKEPSNSNILNIYPFLNGSDSELSFWNLGIKAGFDENGVLQIEKDWFYIPFFAITEFNNDNTDFNIKLS